MNNAATYLAHMRRILEEVYSPVPSDAYPDAELLVYLNEAQRQLVDLLPWLVGESRVNISLTAGVSAYPLPSNLMGKRVQQVTVSDGACGYNLERIPYADALRMGMEDSMQSGGPGYWAFDPSGHILLLPAPERSLTLSLIFDPQPTPLSRVIYQPSSVRATGTAGSTSVSLTAPNGSTPYTGSGETATDDFWTGLEFGFCPVNAPLSSYHMPIMWSRVATSNIATSELTIINTLIASTSNAVFTAGQVSDLEFQNPGRLGTLLPQMASIELLNLSDPKRAQMVQQAIDGKIQGLRPDMNISPSSSHIPVSARHRRGINLR